MNNSRRKQIAKSLATLQEVRDNLKAIFDNEKAAAKLIPNDEEHENIIDELDDYFDNLEEGIKSLDEAINSLESTDF
jgi:exonuclease VII small subunit